MATHDGKPRGLWGREPALWLGALQALLALAVGFGLDLSTEQMALILTASAAVLALATRQMVDPHSQVLERATRLGEVIAGPASELATGTHVRWVGELEETEDPGGQDPGEDVDETASGREG